MESILEDFEELFLLLLFNRKYQGKHPNTAELPIVRFLGLSSFLFPFNILALWPFYHPLTVFYLSQQVEDRDYLEKVSGPLCFLSFRMPYMPSVHGEL